MLLQLCWQPPDWIVFPAGNLGNCAAFGKALREASDLGLIDRVPRVIEPDLQEIQRALSEWESR